MGCGNPAAGSDAGDDSLHVIGTDGVMPGWNAGVVGMKPGGSRMLLLPPAMAYGDRQVEGVVPANAPMMFRIELLSLDDSPDS